MSTADNALMLLVPCHRCGALDLEWCHTRTGKVAATLHSVRYWDTQEARILYWIEQEQAVKRTCSSIFGAVDSKAQSKREYESSNRMVMSLTERLTERLEES